VTIKADGSADVSITSGGPIGVVASAVNQVTGANIAPGKSTGATAAAKTSDPKASPAKRRTSCCK